MFSFKIIKIYENLFIESSFICIYAYFSRISFNFSLFFPFFFLVYFCICFIQIHSKLKRKKNTEIEDKGLIYPTKHFIPLNVMGEGKCVGLNGWAEADLPTSTCI